MDELLPEEIPAIRESVRRFMQTEVLPALDDTRPAENFPEN